MNSLAVIKNPRLTIGQKSLYQLVCQKIKDDNKLVFEEAKGIWLGQVCRHIIDGKPWHYEYVPRLNDPDHWSSELKPMTEDLVNFTVLEWLTSNLGRLILKGYLTVMPAVDLRLLK